MPTVSTNHGHGPGSIRDRRERQIAASPYDTVGPQPGPQTQFLSTPADIALYGGAAGGGKTFALLLEACRHIANPRFGAVFFRNTMPQIKHKGGAWDKATELYPKMGAFPNMTEYYYRFRTGATVAFKALERDQQVQEWGSAQIPLLLIDQAEQFSENMIFGLFGRLRTDIGMKPYARLGCNPDPDCFLKTMVEWWLDDDGYPIESRSGILRWFIRHGGELVWADTRQELIDKFGHIDDDLRPKSFTFIPAKLEDNKILQQLDPEYRGWLLSLPWQEQQRLLKGNWKIKVGAGMFQDEFWKLREYGPADATRVCYWDLADTESNNQNTAATCGVLGAKTREGIFVEECKESRTTEFGRDQFIVNTAAAFKQRYGHVVHWFEQEPGSGGKRDANRNVRLLQGYESYVDPKRKDKVTSAKPWASYVQSGNVYLVTRGADWVKGFIDQHSSFPKAKVKDKVDAASGMFGKLSLLSVKEDVGIYSEPFESTAQRLDRHGAFS
jgi:predicted phage terminase large subunit-like protein